MGTTLHKDLTGIDLHINKVHADTHVAAGTDPLVLAESQVTDLVPDLASKVDEGDARLTDARTPVAHVHSEDQVVDLVSDLADKVATDDARLSDARTPVAHTQAEATVTDLVDDLAGKAPTVHSHVKADISDFPTIGGGTVTAVTGTSPVVSSEGTTPAISLPAATNAAPGHATAAQIAALEAATAAQHAIATIGTGNGLSVAGQAISLAPATASVPGAATAAQITKLDGIAAGAKVGDVVGPPSSVAGHLLTFADTTGKVVQDGGTLPTVNVKTLGAVGNGTTDDTTALQAAITAVASGGKIIIPPGTYKYTSTLVIPQYAVIEGCGESSILLYAGTVSAVDVGLDATLRDVLVQKYWASWTDWNVASPVSGIRLTYVNGRAENVSVALFEKGIHFLGAGVGCSYNQVFLRTLFNNLYGIYLDATTVSTVDGYVNENTINGGRIAVDSSHNGAAAYAGSAWGIYMDSQSAFLPNNNKFMGVSVEGEAHGVHVVGQTNTFVDVRIEIDGAVKVLFQHLAIGDCRYNFFFGGYVNGRIVGTNLIQKDTGGSTVAYLSDQTFFMQYFPLQLQDDLTFFPSYLQVRSHLNTSTGALEYYYQASKMASFAETALTVPGLVVGTSTVTAAGLALIDDANAAAQLATLGAAAASAITNVDNTSDAAKNAAAVTVTNHRFTRRVDTQATTDTITPEISTYDIFIRTAQAHALVINNHSSSTPVDGDMMLFEILGDATARAITYGNTYVAKAGVALPSTTVASKNLTLLFIWRNDLTKWNLLSAGQEA